MLYDGIDAVILGVYIRFFMAVNTAGMNYSEAP